MAGLFLSSFGSHPGWENPILFLPVLVKMPGLELLGRWRAKGSQYGCGYPSSCQHSFLRAWLLRLPNPCLVPGDCHLPEA